MENEQVKRLKNKVEDYEQTVKALLAFAAFVVHDGQERRSDSEFGFGRRMKTSKENVIHAEGTITPDLVAQKNNSYGIVAEIKKSLNRDKNTWHKHVSRLRKYDDTLIGWWTDDGTIAHSDTVFLVHQSRSRPFVRFVESFLSNSDVVLAPSSSIVEFGSSEETSNYYFFRLEYGTVTDDELFGRLNDGIQVPLDSVLRSFPSIKFYDSEPPMPFLLTELWMNVFPAQISAAAYDEGAKAYRFWIDVGSITAELQKAFGSAALATDSRSVEFPRRKFSKRALEILLANKLADRDEEDLDRYQIQYREFRKDVLEHFAIMCSGKMKEKEDVVNEAQLPLFDGDDANES